MELGASVSIQDQATTTTTPVMATTVLVERDGLDFQARPPRRTTTNLSVDFIESSISLAEDSRYIAEIDRFVPVEEAESHEDKM